MIYNNKIWKVWQGIVLFVCVCFLAFPKESLNQTGYFAIFIVMFSSVVSLKMYGQIKEVLKKKEVKVILLAVFLLVVLLFMLPITSLIKNLPLFNRAQFYNGISSITSYLKSDILGHIGQAGFWFYFFKGIFIVGLITNVFSLCLSLLLYPKKIMQQEENEKPKTIGKTGIYYYTLPIAVASVIYMISALPLYAQSDYKAALHFISQGLYPETWSLTWAYFITLLQNIGGGFSIIILQSLFFIWVNNYVIGIVTDISGKRGCRVYVFAMILATAPFIQLMTGYRDSIYSTAFLGLMATNIAIAFKGTKERSDRILWFVFSAIIVLFRQEGLYIIIGSCIFQSLYELYMHISTIKQCIIMVCTLVVTYCIFNFGVPFCFNLDVIEKSPSIAFSIPMNNMAGIAAKNLPIDAEDVEIMEKIMPLEEWKENYDPQNVDPITREYGAVGVRIHNFEKYNLGFDFIRLNAKYFFRYPIEYLEIYARITNIIWEIQPTTYNEWAVVYVRDPNMPQSYEFMQTNATELTRLFSDLAYELPVLHSFAFRGGIYLFIIIAGIFAVMYYNKKKINILVFSPIVLGVACLALAIPVPDTRYISNIMVSGILIFSTVFLTGRRMYN